MVSEEVLINLPIIVHIWHCDRISKIRCHLQGKTIRWHSLCSKIIFIVLSHVFLKDESHWSRLLHYIHGLLDMDRVLKSFSLTQCIISPQYPWHQIGHPLWIFNNQPIQFVDTIIRIFFAKIHPSITSSP